MARIHSDKDNAKGLSSMDLRSISEVWVPIQNKPAIKNALLVTPSIDCVS